MDYKKLREEPLKSSIREDFFDKYKYTQLGNIDFVIAKHMVENMQQSLFEEFENDDLKSILWAEAKPGTSHDIYESFVQLILTIGKERTFDKYLPPKYIGAFDAEKFAFIEYHEIQSIFYQNDFNWNVAPSNHDTKEFRQLYNLCRTLLEDNSIIFNYDTQAHELKEFIRLNFKIGKEMTEKISVTKNNFTFVFQKWSEKVRPTINVDWAKANKAGIISADFFLADLLSSNEESLKDSLYVVLRKTKYELAKKIDALGLISTSTVGFTDKQKAYKQFWSIYARPPKEEYWSYIIGRRDLLVPQDIRERKGSYFTPQIWVEKSQQYLADVLGEAWQEEYYIWDCCAGTGNLLNGLTNYDRVWASTLDKQDVDVMLDRINNGWAMAENHVFQFDFLNDEFTKCPEELQEILNDPKKRHKLVIYINPPYAEAATARTKIGTGQNKGNVARNNNVYAKYGETLGLAANELFSLFLIRIYKEIPSCVLGQFSTLKAVCSSNFEKFRSVFKAQLKKIFVIPADTFDNVKGQFPIGFAIWETAKNREELSITSQSDVYDRCGDYQGTKYFYSATKGNLIIDWFRKYYDQQGTALAYLRIIGTDVQNTGGVHISSVVAPNDYKKHMFAVVSEKNIFPSSVYYAVRHSIDATWLNDRDQFLYPNDGWSKDKVFQTDCLIYTLFHGQNRISSQQGVNHWIPFTREQVGCKKTFKSNFMNEFLKGKKLSPEAQAVYDAGLSLWRYYHGQPNANANASFYDIRRHFQGETNGRMNNDSDDETYTALIADLRDKMKLLARHIEPKVYDYGFLK